MTREEVSTPQTVRRQEPYLLAPTAGYGGLDAAVGARLDSLYRRLIEGGDLGAIEAAARELRAADPGLLPATVLLAQVDYLRLEDHRALEALQPVADAYPDYVALQVLRGGLAERLDEVVTAYQAFAAVAKNNETASERAAALVEPARNDVFDLLDEALDRGQIAAAEDHLAWLERWIGDPRTTLEARRRIAVAAQDRERELRAVCELAAVDEPIREHQERCGDLQLEIGDARAGLDLFERLAERYPDDPVIADQLERAKFLWRLELLPPVVRELKRKVELERADLAALLYWLVPQVRYSQVIDPPIATDILDHPQRDAILRAVTLGLMQIDETLHRFDPGKPVTWQTVFIALLRLVGGADPELDCSGGEAAPFAAAAPAVCRTAAGCRLIPDGVACESRQPVSGVLVLDAFRRGLDLLGSGQPGAESPGSR